MTNCIFRFEGPTFFLSNFWEGEYYMLYGKRWRSVEHGYQAAKAINPEDELKIRLAESAAMAKKLGRRITVRPDWDSIKLDVMKVHLVAKFSDRQLRQQLLDTEGALLVEGNWWHDNFWGVCTCERCGYKGQNHLGRLLMQIRRHVAETERFDAEFNKGYDDRL